MRLTAALVVVLGFGGAPAAEAEVMVIGNQQLPVSSLSAQVVADLYLGRAVQLSTGQRVEVADLPVGHPVRDEFYSRILGRDPDQIRAYWAKRIFTGKGTPPLVRGDEAAMVRWVREAPGRIGYVSTGAVTDSVQVLLRGSGTE
ncbi:MAG: phosphate ABC transporter substrate-binding protein [Gammaproteobacteria bacterium]|jgi:ABC-type phosphate transport system substrate-binding protein|nr:phosphate ABC transporter substrate-binding protein [Gammaproteobacteria bacterium]